MPVQFDVDLGSRSYPIRIGSGIAAEFPSFLRERFGNRRCAVVTNTTVAAIYSSYVNMLKNALGCVVHVVPDGERHKTLGTWNSILESFVASRFDRKSYVVAFGGGVVGDMAGFAAACYMRGIEFVQLPTTLLAMVDSSVGGKTAVDHPVGKNLIGAFHQPSAVWIDVDFLRTLPRREFFAGYAEAFKCAFIGGRDMFSFIAESGGAVLRAEPAALAECIERSVRIKADIVGRDEREAGVRALLNFGHTFAHALEQYYGFSDALIHGEAVLWGIICAVGLAKAHGTLPEQYWPDFDRILRGVSPPPLPAAMPVDSGKVYAAMLSDKKAEAGSLRFVLPTGIGEAAVAGGIGEREVKSALEKVFGAVITL